ncbi:PREDICTED: LOW QUALITY PROTEIN: BMP-binding endothelial regulator protein-like [Cyphomyrmex costatus]|uniref:LOW QUALITY PROTEIN: BMP-binding endothelial regulator protein-like n=1 Tax=Cyphomyrmex costatus TaxID=456900 RepID=UPI0008522C86|nr:PREDICTED: LOW QUALITY PROTEIN: BMP-binding endothelial regulator protein-like [Cyphomyrmex costatus]
MELTRLPSTLALALALAFLSTAHRCDATSESIIVVSSDTSAIYEYVNKTQRELRANIADEAIEFPIPAASLSRSALARESVMLHLRLLNALFLAYLYYLPFYLHQNRVESHGSYESSRVEQVTVFASHSRSRETCDIEGEDITVDKILNTSCFRCICKNGFVECLKQQCPNIEGCYALLDPRDNECCHKCTGCMQNGVYHASDTEWTEENDPCQIFTCKAGVITESRLRCYTPCSHPKAAPSGQCCPICEGCLVNGQKVTEDRSVTTTEDPCVTCKCNKGHLTCAKQACPTLNCPLTRIVNEPGECCPHCRGSARFFSPPKGACMLGTGLYTSGSEFYADHCTRCTCVNSAISCMRETCPVLECPREHQVTQLNRCCRQCSLVEESRASCSYGGRTYVASITLLFVVMQSYPSQDGENWKLDSCKTCTCKQGKVRCAMPQCPPMNFRCPPNSKLEHPEGQCCPRCVERDGVCTVFGDPHYRTFDGKFYSFKGACKYQLVTDCFSHTFSIRVTNDARKTKFSAWTKTIAIKIGDLKVNLGQKMRVKVNGKKVDVPYRVANQLDLNRTDDSVIVNTRIGVKVHWDGISFLEVSVPSSYRSKLCGLCGNFNSQIKDDFTVRHGRVVQDPQQFGQSWVVGGAKKTCPRTKFGNNTRQRPTSLRLLFDILRDVIFLFPRAPSVCESVQTGRGGVLGENLLVTTSYQYALTSDSDSSASSSDCSSTRSGGDFALIRTEISRGSQQHKYAAMTSGTWISHVCMCASRFHAKSRRSERKHYESKLESCKYRKMDDLVSHGVKHKK